MYVPFLYPGLARLLLLLLHLVFKLSAKQAHSLLIIAGVTSR
jgi:hypothetical protein